MCAACSPGDPLRIKYIREKENARRLARQVERLTRENARLMKKARKMLCILESLIEPSEAGRAMIGRAMMMMAQDGTQAEV